MEILSQMELYGFGFKIKHASNVKILVLVVVSILVLQDDLGCVRIPDLVREKKMETEKVDDPIDMNSWIVSHFHFHFLFPHQIQDPNTA